jgi:hypothetical protein
MSGLVKALLRLLLLPVVTNTINMARGRPDRLQALIQSTH